MGYRIGRNYRPHGKGAYIGTRPGKASVQSICRKISEMTAPQHGWKSMEEMVEGLNRTMSGWANYFSLGQVSPAYNAVNRHTGKRLRQWLGRKHKTRAGRFVRYSGREAVRRLQPPASHAANRGLSEREGMISSESRMREIRTSGLMSGGLETGPRETD